MVNSVAIMKWFLILCGITLAAATYTKTSGTVCSQRQDPNYLRQNAENLLFVEYLRRQAAENDLYGWKSVMDTDDFQGRLDEMRTVSENCDSGDDVYDRINLLEGRLTTCGESVSCGSGSSYITLQNDLRRQKLMIQRLYSQILALSQAGSSNCRGKHFIHF